MKTQIVYVLVANENNMYLEEMWVSLYSLRHFHPEAKVNVLVDAETESLVNSHPELRRMITELLVIPTPLGYNAKQRSREIKTTVRQHIKGSYLFIDTDTVICKKLDEIDNLTCDISAVPDGHLPIDECLFAPVSTMQNIFDMDVSGCKYWYNSGVMYVADNERTHTFYSHWNKNWTFSCFEKGNSQDQPALWQTDINIGGIIQKLPDIYNAQIAMSLKYFADAAIVHWWHMDFIEDQNYSPYFSLQIYKNLKSAGTITPDIAEQIINCKQTFVSPSMPVGKEHILFLFSPAGKIYNRIYKEGGAASWLMLKVANWLEKLHRYTKKK